MRKLILLVVIVLAVAYGGPLVAESTGSPCDALEKRVVAVNTPGPAPKDADFDALRRAFLSSLQGFSSGSFATEYVRRQHPNLPVGVGCTLEYWRSFLPDSGLKQPAR